MMFDVIQLGLIPIGAIIGAIGGYRIFGNECGGSRGECVFFTLMSAIIGGLAGGLLGSVLASGYCMVLTGGEKCSPYARIELKAAGDSSELHGAFFLLGGTVDSEEVYRYYYYSNDCPEGIGTCIKKGTVPAYLATIVEEDRSDGYLHICARMNDVAERFGCPIPHTSENTCESNTYVFHIPKGSVVSTFDFNLAE
jgi:hypothetical protein